MAIKSASVQPTRLVAGTTATASGPPKQTGYRVMTPLPDMYGTSTIVEAMKSFVSPEKFLQRNLFGIERYFEGRYLTVDVKGMRRVLSPVVSRWHPGVTVKRPEVQTSVYDVPRLAPVRNTSWEIWISGLLASVHKSLRLCDLCKELAFGTLRRRS